MKEIKKEDTTFLMSDSLVERLSGSEFLEGELVDKNLTVSILYEEGDQYLKDIYSIENTKEIVKISFIASPSHAFSVISKKINTVCVKISDDEEMNIQFDKDSISSSAVLNDPGLYICQIVLNRI